MSTISEKKNQKQFIAIVIACILVAAAIVYVVFAAVMSKSAFLTDQALADTLAKALGKPVRSVSEQDLSDIRVFAVMPNEKGELQLNIGYDDLIAEWEKARQDEAYEYDANDYFKTAVFKELPQSIDDYRYLTGLKNFTDTSSPIQDTAIFNAMPELEAINAYLSADADLSPIGTITGLEILALYSGPADITALAGLTNLDTLVLQNMEITDILSLQNMTALKTLDLSYNAITDLSPLKNLTALKDLVVTGNQVADISVVSGMTELENLYFYKNSVSDLSPLAGLTKLEIVHAGGNQITDLSPLAQLNAENLQYLFLNENSGITDWSYVESFGDKVIGKPADTDGTDTDDPDANGDESNAKGSDGVDDGQNNQNGDDSADRDNASGQDETDGDTTPDGGRDGNDTTNPQD